MATAISNGANYMLKQKRIPKMRGVYIKLSAIVDELG